MFSHNNIKQSYVFKIYELKVKFLFMGILIAVFVDT